MLKIMQTHLKRTEKYESRKVSFYNDDFDFTFYITYEHNPLTHIRLIIKGELDKKRLGKEGKTKIEYDKKFTDYKVFELKNGLQFPTRKRNGTGPLTPYSVTEFLDLALDKMKNHYEKLYG